MSKTTVRQVRMKGEIVISNYWLTPTEVNDDEEEKQYHPQEGYGKEWVEEMEYTMEEEEPEKEAKVEIIPTKPPKTWNPT